MTRQQHLDALFATSRRIDERHGAPFLMPIPANDDWLFEEDGA